MLVTLLCQLSRLLKRLAKAEKQRQRDKILDAEFQRDEAYQKEARQKEAYKAAYEAAKAKAAEKRKLAIDAIHDNTSKALVSLSELENI